MKRTFPNPIWKKIRKESIPAVGEQFWEDLSSFMPVTGPRVDSYIDRDQVVTVMELPGVASAEHLHLSIRGHTLHLRGEIPYMYPLSEEQLLVNERFAGTFHRQIELPKEVDPQGVSARLEFGLLTVTIPLTEERELAVHIDDTSGQSKEDEREGRHIDGEVHISGSTHPGGESFVRGVYRTQPANPLEKQSKNQ